MNDIKSRIKNNIKQMENIGIKMRRNLLQNLKIEKLIYNKTEDD